MKIFQVSENMKEMPENCNFDFRWLFIIMERILIFIHFILDSELTQFPREMINIIHVLFNIICTPLLRQLITVGIKHYYLF